MHTLSSVTLEDMANLENILEAWREFLPAKRTKPDVQEFSLRLMDNLISLRNDLLSRKYRHGGYHAFGISDPKPRRIHKASVRDRVLHHAVYRVLYPLFDPVFVSDSFSCRKDKGTHRALERFSRFGRKASVNHTKTCWVLKCDIRKFFENIDHGALEKMLASYIPDKEIRWLLHEIIGSFHSHTPGKGLPLGNLTSQLLVKIYMDKFDQFAKHGLRARWYIRYADDFVFFSPDRAGLESLIPRIRTFLREKLQLELHPDKLFIKTLASGVDFLGWVHFPDHRVIRTATKKRMMKRIR